MRSELATKERDLLIFIEPYLSVYLNDDSYTEICINQPGEVFTEGKDGWKKHDRPDIDFQSLDRLATMTKSYTNQTLSRENPILSGTWPKGERVQIAIPPAAREGTISFTIRKHLNIVKSLEDYRKDGAFDECEETIHSLTPVERELLALKKNREFVEFFSLAVRERKNIVISGSTGSGKSTFFRSLLAQVSSQERLLSIENADELELYKTHPNSVALFYSAGGQGQSKITQKHLIESALRMNPDRVFLAELIRGDEAFYYMRNVNSGHPGSITTMHANSPSMAWEQLVLFLKESEAGRSLSRDDIKQLLFMCVDIIIQIKKVNGRRIITEVWYEPELKLSQMA